MPQKQQQKQRPKKELTDDRHGSNEAYNFGGDFDALKWQRNEWILIDIAPPLCIQNDLGENTVVTLRRTTKHALHLNPSDASRSKVAREMAMAAPTVLFDTESKRSQ